MPLVIGLRVLVAGCGKWFFSSCPGTVLFSHRLAVAAEGILMAAKDTQIVEPFV